ncbi:hypothetical protein [Caniella muris]|nr:hypothetical protein [Caniella muris]
MDMRTLGNGLASSAGDIRLSAEEVAAVDAALDAMEMGPVFGGSAAASHE